MEAPWPVYAASASLLLWRPPIPGAEACNMRVSDAPCSDYMRKSKSITRNPCTMRLHRVCKIASVCSMHAFGKARGTYIFPPLFPYPFP